MPRGTSLSCILGHIILRHSPQGKGLVGFTDTQPSMLPGISWKRNVRSKFWWFRSRAIRITYRISLRSSSLWEPRHPSLKVVFWHLSYERGHHLQPDGHMWHPRPLFALGYGFCVLLFCVGWQPWGLKSMTIWPISSKAVMPTNRPTVFTVLVDLRSMVW